MKLGKIYSYINKDEAKYLIGKRVLATDLLYRLENPTENHPKIGIFKGFSEDKELPFNIALSKVDDCLYQFIREIEEEPKLMTNRQLSEWLAKGNGEWVTALLVGVRNDFSYAKGTEDSEVNSDFRIRPWDSDEWVKPTVEIYERYCKKRSEE